MDTKKFQDIVAEAIDKLPDEFRNTLDNIDIVVEDWPTNEELGTFEKREGLPEGKGEFLLLGLYQGVPLGNRSSMFYTGVLPDKITLFKGSIEKYCREDEKEMTDQIRRTLLHEIGHYFGIKDKRLRELGY